MNRVDLIGAWDGWSADLTYLYDSAGNKYLPGDLRASFYGRQLYKELTGSTTKIRSLKEYLEDRAEAITPGYHGKV